MQWPKGHMGHGREDTRKEVTRGNQVGRGGERR